MLGYYSVLLNAVIEETSALKCGSKLLPQVYKVAVRNTSLPPMELTCELGRTELTSNRALPPWFSDGSAGCWSWARRGLSTEPTVLERSPFMGASPGRRL